MNPSEVRAVAIGLMTQLSQRDGWSPTDIADGRAAVERNPQDAADLFAQMLGSAQESDADERRRCIDCRKFRAGRCADHHRAGLGSPVVGPELSRLLQHCPAHEKAAMTRSEAFAGYMGAPTTTGG